MRVLLPVWSCPLTSNIRPGLVCRVKGFSDRKGGRGRESCWTVDLRFRRTFIINHTSHKNGRYDPYASPSNKVVSADWLIHSEFVVLNQSCGVNIPPQPAIAWHEGFEKMPNTGNKIWLWVLWTISGLHVNINGCNNLNGLAIIEENGLELFNKIIFYGNFCSESPLFYKLSYVGRSAPGHSERPGSLRLEIESPKTNWVIHVYPATGGTSF